MATKKNKPSKKSSGGRVKPMSGPGGYRANGKRYGCGGKAKSK